MSYAKKNGSSAATLFSGYLRSEAFLLQAVRNQTICFHCSRCALFPSLLCAGAMCSGQLFSVHIVCRFTLRVLHLYKCWDNALLVHEIDVKDNLLNGTIDKATTNCLTAVLRLRKMQPSSSCNCSTCLHKVQTHLYIYT